ncbi:hypothetical protein ACFWN7_05315 [Agromyces sp. NPDC058484]|uniref:hypothetical protein n=1 Tax=Agromyces sp. NPDC058484 TaxID=3346524 RepID=UPI00365A630E
MATDPLTAAADELYALVPEEFTAARNARAKEAKADDRELGARVGELKRPSPAAWIVNRLVREHPDTIDELSRLGVELREAQAAGDGTSLTTIGSGRRKLISAALEQANEIADAAGRPPSRAVLDEVEQTLIAATVDESAGEAFRTGRLVRSLQAVGFEDVDLDGAVAGEASAARPTKRTTARPARSTSRERQTGADEHVADARASAERDTAARAERERAEADVREARDRADEAKRALAEAGDLLHAAEWNADELRDERHDLETRLKELRTEIADAERDERDAERVRAKAATAAARARDDVEAAETALDRLD